MAAGLPSGLFFCVFFAAISGFIGSRPIPGGVIETFDKGTLLRPAVAVTPSFILLIARFDHGNSAFNSIIVILNEHLGVLALAGFSTPDYITSIHFQC